MNKKSKILIASYPSFIGIELNKLLLSRKYTNVYFDQNINIDFNWDKVFFFDKNDGTLIKQ